jgi:alanine-synthesizing transaminase
MDSLTFALYLLDKGQVAVSPGIGFGPSGDGHVRFALVENDQRTAQAVRGIRKALDLS